MDGSFFDEFAAQIFGRAIAARQTVERRHARGLGVEWVW
jgi:hypothetical protein